MILPLRNLSTAVQSILEYMLPPEAIKEQQHHMHVMAISARPWAGGGDPGGTTVPMTVPGSAVKRKGHDRAGQHQR